MRWAAVAAVLAAMGASAQTVVHINQPPPPEPAIGFLFELKMGTLIPRVGDEPGLTSNPYQTIFGNKSMLYGGGEFAFIAWHGYGAVSVGFAAGYAEKYAPAIIQRTGELSSEKTALIIFPLRLPVAYRFDLTWSRWGIAPGRARRGVAGSSANTPTVAYTDMISSVDSMGRPCAFDPTAATR